MTCRFVLLLLVASVSFALAQAANPLSFDLSSEDLTYSISANGNLWLSSDSATAFSVYAGSKWRSASDGSLTLSSVQTGSGSDNWGEYTSQTLSWSTGDPAVPDYHTVIRTYSAVPAIVLEQKFVSALNGTAFCDVLPTVNPNGCVMSSFPSFEVEAPSVLRKKRGIHGHAEPSELGFLNWRDSMIQVATVGKWDSENKQIPGGVDVGPFVLFDSSGNSTLIISPLSNFMAASTNFISSTKQHALQFGIMGSVTEIPAGYSYETVLFYSEDGINLATQQWGAAMMKRYNTPADRFAQDLSLNYLGYYTDNGAYYYYNTEVLKTYEETMIDVQQYSIKANIPYRFVQLDSWWYYKGNLNGVKNWTARPDVFPHGLAYLHNVTSWPVVAHNRYWSNDTTYAKANGGAWDFILEENGFAVPTSRAFWDYLLSSSREWGLMTYEQDWLYNEFLGVKSLQTSPTLARTWLMQMGQAAADAGLTVQYCMPYPRHALQSLELPAVDQIRVSDDYHPDYDTNWRIGVSSILASALGLAPSKDTFWSSTSQPLNPYGLTEDYPELVTAAAIFSTGPVVPGDGNGYSNVKRIMRTCMKDGTLLQPSRPATAVDATFLYSAFGTGVNGELWSTFSEVSQWRWFHFLAPELNDAYSMSIDSVRGAEYTRSANADGAMLMYTIDYVYEDFNAGIFSETQPLEFRASNMSTFYITHTSPIWQIGSIGNWALLGDLSKYVPVAPERVAQVTVDENGIVADLRGVEGEAVNITGMNADTSQIVQCLCIFPAWGSLSCAIPAGTCS